MTCGCHFTRKANCFTAWCSIPPKTVPGQKNQVVILFDFSGSMGEDKVSKAKDVAIIIAEGLKERFDVQLYLYTTNGSFTN